MIARIIKIKHPFRTYTIHPCNFICKKFGLLQNLQNNTILTKLCSFLSQKVILLSMLKSYKSHSFINGLRFSCSRTLRENRGKFILTLILVLIAIFAGIFVAIKYSGSESLSRLQEISLDDFKSGFVGSSSAFFSRMLSLSVNALILFGVSFVPVLFPIAEILIVYRAYLFGLNFALIFILYGLGGSLTAIVVILPCQLLTLFALIMFYLILSKINGNCKRYGRTECNRFIYLLVGLLILLILNFAETLLLFLLNGKVILVI